MRPKLQVDFLGKEHEVSKTRRQEEKQKLGSLASSLLGVFNPVQKPLNVPQKGLAERGNLAA